MEQKKRRFAVLTGGGDCRPIKRCNPCGCKKTFLQNDCEVYGVLNGFNGLDKR